MELNKFKEYEELAGGGGAVGLSRGARIFAAAKAAASGAVLFVTADAEGARKYAEEFSRYNPDTYFLPPSGGKELKNAVNGAAARRRTAAAAALLSGKKIIVTAAAAALTEEFPSPAALTVKLLRVGDVVPPGALIPYLADAGYSRENLIGGHGQFSVRGDIVDIFPPDLDAPVRVNFFGDAIESIRAFDLEKQTSLFPLSAITVIPAEIRGAGFTLFDYLPRGAAVVYDEPKLISGVYTFGAADKNFTRLYFTSLLTLPPEVKPDKIFKYSDPPLPNYHADFDAFSSDVKGWTKNGYTVLCMCGGAENAAAFSERLAAHGITSPNVKPLADGVISGLILPKDKTVIAGTRELFRKSAYTGRTAAARAFDAYSEFKTGDYVVHESAGIGICAGISKLTNVTDKDYIIVNYKDGDVLYVPVEQSNLLKRYSGASPKINRIGGGEFERVKDKVRSDIKKMSFDLIELYKKRRAARGFVFSPDNALTAEFEDAFPYAETSGQLAAAADVKRDMEAGAVMDRLLAADVGYGKTEVALRAAFKAVLDKKQVAFLCPTTVLCRQHYDTATRRLKDFGVITDFLSRFKSPKEEADTVRRVNNGEIDLIIGTHRLLSKDVKFADLGLLILDEEQRFGVEDKEKIKLLKSGVNVLSLSATPIPRTLHLSLSGIRDISVIETPPPGRLPVETFVAEYSDRLIAEALSRELARGGQAFVVYNRVRGIETFAARIKNLLPAARLIVAHGQMPPESLEKAIIDFYDYKADVLISTTIIENGVDLSRANTLIVADADRLGLAQLYQLRGRVGRSNRLAYAYFLYNGAKFINETAYKRLAAVMEFTELNSGFKIAMRDLEIRGAGNVLGREQHGHMDAVGYDMYCKLLAECIGELSGNTPPQKTASPLMDVQLPAYAPDEYMDEPARMKLYRQIASMTALSERAEILAALSDIYGAPPEPLINLVNVAALKMLGANLLASQITIKPSKLEIRFSSVEALNNPALFAAIDANKKICLLDPSVPKLKFKPLPPPEAVKLLEEFLLLAQPN